MDISSSGDKTTDSLNGKLTFEQNKNRIVGRDENNVARLLILANGVDFVMKVSKEGVDVLTASDENLIFNSGQNIVKIVSTGSFALPALDAAGGANDTSTTLYNTGVTASGPLEYNAYVINDSGGYTQLPQITFNYSGSLQIYRSAAVELIGGQVWLRIFSQNYTGSPRVATTLEYQLTSETIV